MKKIDKMSAQEMRNELQVWRKIGENILYQLEHRSEGDIGRFVYISKGFEARVREFVE